MISVDGDIVEKFYLAFYQIDQHNENKFRGEFKSKTEIEITTGGVLAPIPTDKIIAFVQIKNNTGHRQSHQNLRNTRIKRIRNGHAPAPIFFLSYSKQKKKRSIEGDGEPRKEKKPEGRNQHTEQSATRGPEVLKKKRGDARKFYLPGIMTRIASEPVNSVSSTKPVTTKSTGSLLAVVLS